MSVNAYNRPPVALLVGGSRLLSLSDPAAQFTFDASRSFAYGQVIRAARGRRPGAPPPPSGTRR